jgi:hypothetical protein
MDLNSNSNPNPNPPPKAPRNVGSAEMTRLWAHDKAHDMPDMPSQQPALPSLSEFVEPLIEEIKEGLEAEYRCDHNPVFQFRAMRLIAKQYPDQLKRVCYSSLFPSHSHLLLYS